MTASLEDFSCGGNDRMLQIIGAGPAGISLVLALCNRIAAAHGDAVREQYMLDNLKMFEAGSKPGGEMGHYHVNANTSAHDVVRGIGDGTPFVAVRDHYLEQSGLILQATGFASKLPIVERQGRAIRVGNPTSDGELRDLDSAATVAGLFGMGLGLNILPPGAPRGEPSFAGGIHGFQSYPLSIAPRIINRLLADIPTEMSN